MNSGFYVQKGELKRKEKNGGRKENNGKKKRRKEWNTNKQINARR
jgi:hypothetical protein